MRPKPTFTTKFIHLSLLCLLVLAISHDVLAQNQIDSLKSSIVVDDSISSELSKIDSLGRNIDQLSDRQSFNSSVTQKIDSSQNALSDKLRISATGIDTLVDQPVLQKLLPKSTDIAIKPPKRDIGKAITDQKIDVPNVPKIGMNKLKLGALQGKREQINRHKSKINVHLQVKEEFDSVSRESIERKVEELAKDNFTELKELEKMEAASQSARAKVKNIQWDKSKINSSKNIANVLSENVSSIQKGMDKMKDFKGKYSKVNLMNPNGPVLTKISKKPTKPWQFSLNLSSQFRNGISLQLAPTVGYKLHEKWIGGIGISYQLQIIDKDSSFTFAPRQEFSHRIFNQFNFYKNFFLHVEHELPYKQQYEKEEGEWYNLDPQKPKGWIGLALQYGVYKKIKGQTQILYNIIKPDMGTENRWTIRVNLIF